MCIRKSLDEMAKTEENLGKIGKREYREFTEKVHWVYCMQLQTIIKMSNILFCISFPSGFVYSVEWQHHISERMFHSFHSTLFYWNSKTICKEYLNFLYLILSFFLVSRGCIYLLSLWTDWLNSCFWLTAWTPKNK